LLFINLYHDLLKYKLDVLYALLVLKSVNWATNTKFILNAKNFTMHYIVAILTSFRSRTV